MKLIYVAHVFSGIQSNADRAESWTARLNWRIQGAVFICPWLPMVRCWVDSGETRALGIILDRECVRHCDALLALSPLLGGVKSEWDLATDKILCDTSMIVGEPSAEWLGFEVIQAWINSMKDT
jgi:hypothetical protein